MAQSSSGGKLNPVGNDPFPIRFDKLKPGHGVTVKKSDLRWGQLTQIKPIVRIIREFTDGNVNLNWEHRGEDAYFIYRKG